MVFSHELHEFSRIYLRGITTNYLPQNCLKCRQVRSQLFEKYLQQVMSYSVKDCLSLFLLKEKVTKKFKENLPLPAGRPDRSPDIYRGFSLLAPGKSLCQSVEIGVICGKPIRENLCNSWQIISWVEDQATNYSKSTNILNSCFVPVMIRRKKVHG